MSSKIRWITRTMLGGAVFAAVMSLAPVAEAGCTGPMYIYFETSALQVETGAKLVCPAAIIYDEGPNGEFQQTSHFVVQTMVCPCTGGGGNGGGENEDQDG